MAVAWTDITNAQVAAGAAVTTALMTALRDNPEGIAQRAAGAPKIFGVPYDYQEFTSSGTWTKPANAESGDVVVVYVVAGGGAGGRGSGTGQGGMGGGGAMHRFENIDDLAATEAVVVGAGGNPGSGSGGNGGNSSFGTSTTAAISSPGAFLLAVGGRGGSSSGGGLNDDYLNYSYVMHTRSDLVRTGNDLATSGNLMPVDISSFFGGRGGQGANEATGGNSVFGGGGGGASVWGNAGTAGGMSMHAGRGGNSSGLSANIADYAIDGEFPGGGGGFVDTGSSGDTVGGAGGAGVVRVWCLREQA